MANEEHLAMLRQGVEVWNKWRQGCQDRWLNLAGADLRTESLEEVNLKGVNLNEADLRGSNLTSANLDRANLERTNLGYATLKGARLVNARLQFADLRGANLEGSTLRGASLNGAYLDRTILRKANLERVAMGNTIFVGIDLTESFELNRIMHLGPSTVDCNTLMNSRSAPTAFWRGCGLPDALIEYIPSLTGDAIQFYSCFISYSSKDHEIAKRLHADLQDNGVRCWFAPHDMRTGDRIRDTIDEQIGVYEKLLIILSDSSVTSNWVENEVEAAMERETDRKTVLFPIRIDEAVEDSEVAWARTIRRTRHITDFSAWKDHDAYQKALERLLRDLKVKS